MKELYWINVLGNLGVATLVLLIVFTLVVICILLPNIFGWAEASDNGREDEAETYASSISKVCKYSILPWLFLLLGVIFIPSRDSLYMIYGLGSTIDYIKQNDTAKQLPDKVIVALDKWVDNLTVDKEKESEDN